MLDERFWSKVDKSNTNGCWEWTANKNNKGYGMFSVSSYAGKQLAHRLSYKDAFGPIPSGGLILHSCDNPRCVNPAHLRVGTHKENASDMDERGRRVSNPARGMDNCNAKLTDTQVISLLQDYVAGVPRKDIAEKHSLSEHSISDYTDGKSWVHLHGINGCPTLADLEAAKRRTPVTERTVRKIWRLHLSGKTVPEIVKASKQSLHSVEGIVYGKTWRHLSGAPSLDELKSGGVKRGYNQFSNGGDTRSLHPRTKVPSSEIPSILKRIQAGETLDAIGKTYGVKKTAIWRIKNASFAKHPSSG